MKFVEKIVPFEALGEWRRAQRQAGRCVVATNGCFDILHLGHAVYLECARALGDILLVGVTSDDNVRALKGPGRPLNSERDRATVLAALESVGAVCVFPERDARNFLEVARPDVYAKGGDYTLDTINQDERRLLERMGVRLALLGNVPGKSTTALVEKMGPWGSVRADEQ